MSASTLPSGGQITTTPASASPGWRASVIVLVALLAVGIGAALGAYLINGRGAGLGTASSYVPADAAMYVEVRVIPSAEQDAALRDVLRRFPPIDGLDLDRPLGETLPELLDELSGVAGHESISWSSDVATWFDGRIGLAASGASALDASGATAGGEGPDGLLLLGVTDRAAAAAAIDRLLAASGSPPEFTDSEHAGVTIRESSTGGAYALTDDQLLVAFTAETIRAALDARASGDTLAASGDLSGYAARLPADWLIFATYDLSTLLSESLASMGAQAPEMATALEALYESQPARLAYSVSATADGLAFDAFSDLPTGPFAPVNADRGLAGEVPDDAFVFADGGNVGPGLSAIIEALESSVSAYPEVAEQIATIETALGGELSELVGWIGDGAFVIGRDDAELYAGMVLVPTDVAEAERRLGQLATFARLAAADPTTGIGVTEEAMETASGPVTITRVLWQPAESAAPPAPTESLPFTALVIEYAVTDDRALVGIGGSFVRRALALDPAGALAADPRYRDAVMSLGGIANAGTTWVDLAGLREAAEAFVPVEAEMQYQNDVLPWLAPLDRLVAVARVDGTTLESHAVLFIE